MSSCYYKSVCPHPQGKSMPIVKNWPTSLVVFRNNWNASESQTFSEGTSVYPCWKTALFWWTVSLSVQKEKRCSSSKACLHLLRDRSVVSIHFFSFQSKIQKPQSESTMCLQGCLLSKASCGGFSALFEEAASQRPSPWTWRVAFLRPPFLVDVTGALLSYIWVI